MIKKIELIHNSTAAYALYKMQFYTKVDGVWALFNPGATSSYTTTKAVFAKMTVTSTRKSNYSNGLEYIFNGKGAGNSTYFTTGKVGDKITITFNEPLKVLAGIYYVGKDTWTKYAQIKIYDENNRTIHANLSPTLVAGVHTSSASFYDTEELSLMRVYPTNTVGTIVTNDNTQIKDVYQVDSITVTQNTPADTDIKYLISFDGRKTYKTYKDGEWSDVDISNSSNIIEQGLTKAELEALTSEQYTQVMTENRTVDVLTGMMTNSEYTTPSISQIKILYLKIV